jgi:hypothetical protein
MLSGTDFRDEKALGTDDDCIKAEGMCFSENPIVV